MLVVLFPTPAVSTITVEAVNDTPVVNLDLNNSGGGLDDLGFEVTYTEGDAAVNVADILDGDVTDAENNVTSLEIVAGNINDGAAEVVTIAGETFVLDSNQSFTGVTVGGSSVDLAYDATTGIFSVTNSAGNTTPIPQGDLDTLIQGITYENTSDNPTAGDRTLSFTATDADGADFCSCCFYHYR